MAKAAEEWLIEDDVDAQVRWEVVKAHALVRLGERDEAERHALRAINIAWGTEYWNLRAISQEALAEVLRRTGRTNEAADALRKAIDVYEGKGTVVSAAAARKALAGLRASTNASQS